ncbi:hypothetical protein L7F22_027778 [Adiantum nelumboides]|nr:hypothetical protein [Adiantum nelumboides]
MSTFTKGGVARWKDLRRRSLKAKCENAAEMERHAAGSIRGHKATRSILQGPNSRRRAPPPSPCSCSSCYLSCCEQVRIRYKRARTHTRMYAIYPPPPPGVQLSDMLSIRQPPPIAIPARRLLQDMVINGASTAPPPSFFPPPIPAQSQFPQNRFPQPPPRSMAGDINHFSPSVAIIMVVLLSAFFFMGFFSLYVRRCADGSSADGRASHRRGGEIYQEHPDQGVDPDFLHSLPLVAYSSRKKRGNNVECVVCLTEFEEQEPLRQLPICKHVFHQDCIDMWLFSHSTCPLCRRNVVTSTRSLSFRSWGGSGSFRHLTFLSRGSSTAQNIPPRSEDPGTVSLISSNISDAMVGIPRSVSAEVSSATSARGTCAGANLEIDCSNLQSTSIMPERQAGKMRTFSGNCGALLDRSAKRQLGTNLARANSTGHSLQQGQLAGEGKVGQELAI